MQMSGFRVGAMERDGSRSGGLSAGTALLIAVCVGAIAATAPAADATRIDQFDRTIGSADAVAGLALLASAVLVGIVAMARTRLASQEAEIERLRALVPELDPSADPCGKCGAREDEWIERAADTAADRSVLRVSER